MRGNHQGYQWWILQIKKFGFQPQRPRMDVPAGLLGFSPPNLCDETTRSLVEHHAERKNRRLV